MMDDIFLPMVGISSIFGIGVGILLAIIAWEIVWKGIALWYSARRKQMGWFIAILIINSAGILPIIYLLVYKGKKYQK